MAGYGGLQLTSQFNEVEFSEWSELRHPTANDLENSIWAEPARRSLLIAVSRPEGFSPRMQYGRGAKRRRSFLTAENQIGAVFYLIYFNYCEAE